MKGSILINAYFDSEDYLYQPKRLSEEFAIRGIDCPIRRNDFFPITVGERMKNDYSDCDFIVYQDKDKYILRGLENAGIRVFNSARSIEECDDKMLTYLALADCGIPMPKTLPGLLCYSEKERIREETADRLEKELGYPLVAKESFGSLGKGVYLIHNRAELIAVTEKLKCKPHLFQEYIRCSYGRDVRLITVGEEILGGMKRISEGDFRSNIGSGGKGIPFEPTEKMVEIAKKVVKKLRLDYCGMDILFGEDGPILCEVNSNAFFKTFEQVTGINVAGRYVEYILEEMKNK